MFRFGFVCVSQYYFSSNIIFLRSTRYVGCVYVSSRLKDVFFLSHLISGSETHHEVIGEHWEKERETCHLLPDKLERTYFETTERKNKKGDQQSNSNNQIKCAHLKGKEWFCDIDFILLQHFCFSFSFVQLLPFFFFLFLQRLGFVSISILFDVGSCCFFSIYFFTSNTDVGSRMRVCVFLPHSILLSLAMLHYSLHIV